MIPSIRSEARKLLTARSTYLMLIFSVLIIGLFAGFVEGFRNSQAGLNQSGLLASESTSAIIFVGLVLAFAGLLLFGHEYRYNTIMYTLTSSNSRLKSLFAKVIVVSVFAVVLSLIVTFLSPLFTIIGAQLQGKSVGPQVFDYWSVIWRCVLVGWGYAMYALILVALIRNQIGSIVTFLLMPLLGENILMMLLKQNSKYLPFTSLQSVVQPGMLEPAVNPVHQAAVVVVYVVVGLVVSAILFVRRDAN